MFERLRRGTAASCTICFLICLFPLTLIAEEEILSYTSRIVVVEDGSLIVEETIQVRSEQKKIKRGIFRDFPTERQTFLGFRRGSSFRVLSVKRDGVPENYVVENIQGDLGGDVGKRIKIGNKNIVLPAGVYTYEIEYQTDNQLDYTDYYDVLLWNVTGNGWVFPIKRAAAYISLPDGIGSDDVELGGFTGVGGSKEQTIRTAKDRLFFTIEADRELRMKEGLTIRVAWPKGFVYEPTESEKWERWFLDNKDSLFALIGLLVVFTYYYLIWREVGVDPPAGTIIPEYKAPEDLSPAAVRYLNRMAFDKKAFTAELIQIAVSGYIKIEKDGSDYTIVKTGNTDEALTSEQKKLIGRLLGSSNSVSVEQENYKKFQKARDGLQKDLKAAHLKRHFHKNRSYFYWGTGLSLVVIFFSAFMRSAESFGATAFITVWLSGWSFGVFFLLKTAYDKWMEVFRGEVLSTFGAVFISLFCIPFVAGWCFGFFFFITAAGLPIGIVAILLGLIGYLFFHLLKAPTLRGRKILDRIDGFKLYLGVAEEERLHTAAPPEQSLETFEKFLPYALALDVEQEWSEKFADVIAKASASTAQAGYSPSFYRGTNFSNISAFSSAMRSSFSSALSSASSSPRSSGGGGGGGFSGGGGGGGGGGGW